MNESGRFCAEVTASLRIADRSLRMAERGDHRTLFGICRAAMSGITTVDSFIIAFYQDDLVVYPYTYDHGHYLPPAARPVPPHSLAYVIRETGRTYAYSSDDGWLLGRALPFGRVDEVSQDAVVVPLRRPGGTEVVGMMNVQTMHPGHYDDEVVRAAEWLGAALMLALAREEAEHESLDLYALYPELDSNRLRDGYDLLAEVGHRMAAVHAGIEGLRPILPPDASPRVHAALDELVATCERAQTELADLVRRQDAARSVPPASLTDRELQIAQLIARQGCTNAELAQQLHISLKTVKTHVGNVLRKLGVTQRSEIAWVLEHPGGPGGA